MTKIATKVELNDKIIFTKPLNKEDKLITIRELIKDRIDSSFFFLDQEGNSIDKKDENDFKLEDIVNGKIMKLKSEGGGSDNNLSEGIKVFLGDKIFCSIDCEKTENLSKARQLIKDKCKEDFIFLDSEGNNTEQEDEKDLAIEDILINEIIKIKLKDSSVSTPNITDKKPRSKENNKKINKITDFSQFEILQKKKDLTIYKYSNLKRVSNHPYVYQYFYDKYNPKDYSDAYIVLFCGKTGDGKSTAINAFFNIIKGVELHDDYRFILIIEPKKDKGQAESQTDGVHLYYLKDYSNKPVIVIDSQGYGDTRGKQYDEMINDAFSFVFSSVIDHINTVCFISKSNNNRLDILTRYIFSSVTSLFSEDISENFIVTSTFATKETIEIGPAFVESIQTDAEFLKIQNRLDEKWWYAFDSKSILDNEEDKLTKYSIKQLTDLYEEKVKKLRPKGIKKCAEVLETRKELKVQVNLLSDTFNNLLIHQFNLEEKEKVINEISIKIKEMETKISTYEREAQKLGANELKKKTDELNQELDKELNDLNNDPEKEYITCCEYYDNDTYFTHCNSCERNCHNFCECTGKRILGRCKVFSWGFLGFGKVCEECKCPKDNHKIDHYRYIKKRVDKKKDKENKIKEERDKKTKESKNNLDKQKEQRDILNNNKNKLDQEKTKNIKDRNEIQKKILDTKNLITLIIIRLKNISNKINDIAMNNNHLKTEEEYIDNLESNMKEIGIEDNEQKRFLKEQKDLIKVFRETNKLDDEELMKYDVSQLADKLKIIIPPTIKQKLKK